MGNIWSSSEQLLYLRMWCSRYRRYVYIYVYPVVREIFVCSPVVKFVPRFRSRVDIKRFEENMYTKSIPLVSPWNIFSWRTTLVTRSKPVVITVTLQTPHSPARECKHDGPSPTTAIPNPLTSPISHIFFLFFFFSLFWGASSTSWSSLLFFLSFFGRDPSSGSVTMTLRPRLRHSRDMRWLSETFALDLWPVQPIRLS